MNYLERSLLCILQNFNFYITEGEDFAKVEATVKFKPGEDKRPLTVVIIDDDESPVLEKKEVFDLILTDPDKTIITMPEKAKIIIDDTQQDKDAPLDKNVATGKLSCHLLSECSCLNIFISFFQSRKSLSNSFYMRLRRISVLLTSKCYVKVFWTKLRQ